MSIGGEGDDILYGYKKIDTKSSQEHSNLDKGKDTLLGGYGNDFFYKHYVRFLHREQA
jgi:hypothetical protein